MYTPFLCTHTKSTYVQLVHICSAQSATVRSISQSKTGKQSRHSYTRLFAYYYHRNTPEISRMYSNSQYCVNYRFDSKLLVYRVRTWNNRRKSLDSLVDFKLYICLLPRVCCYCYCCCRSCWMQWMCLLFELRLFLFSVSIHWCAAATHLYFSLFNPTLLLLHHPLDDV